MKTESTRKPIQSEKTQNEVILQFLNHGNVLEQRSTDRKIKELLIENTQLKQQLQNRAYKTNEILNHNQKIVSIIAHDLRSPYNSLLDALDLLRQNAASMNKEELSSYFNLIYNTTNNSLELLDNLLGWTTLNSSSRKFSPNLLNLDNVVEGVLDNLKPISEMKGINVVNNIPANLETLADQNMLATVIRNLVTNAIQYNHQGGHVLISAKVVDKLLEVEIRDDGMGINEDDLDKLIYNPEENVAMGSKEGRWKGLGLMFCREFIEMHGGDMKIESMVGVGTAVKFTIPLSND